jgi:hypothetical protein
MIPSVPVCELYICMVSRSYRRRQLLDQSQFMQVLSWFTYDVNFEQLAARRSQLHGSRAVEIYIFNRRFVNSCLKCCL